MSDVSSFMNYMSEMNCKFVAIEEHQDSGFMQVLCIDNDFFKVYGNAMAHVTFCDYYMSGGPFIIEGEQGIGIRCLLDADDDPDDDDGSIISILFYEKEE